MQHSSGSLLPRQWTTENGPQCQCWGVGGEEQVSISLSACVHVYVGTGGGGGGCFYFGIFGWSSVVELFS